ncbi:MAG: hypothetical protein RIC80_10255 [Cyclobacteriaceae bacterium]
MLKLLLISGMLFCFSPLLLAQEEVAIDEEEEGKNLIAATVGYTYIREAGELGATEADGFFVPTIGLDYFRKVHTKWEIGLMLDLELGQYLIIKKELERERAFIAAFAGAYKVTPNFQLVAGAGIELEKHKNLAILRLGAERQFNLGNEWRLGPAFFFDFKEGYDTWSLSLSLGKEF